MSHCESLSASLTTFVKTKLLLAIKSGRIGMEVAMIKFSTNEFRIALNAFEILDPCKHLPKDLRPWNLFLSKEHHKFINVP
jgi:hypothetical protein